MATNSDNLERYKTKLGYRDPKDLIHIPANTPIAKVIKFLLGPPDLTGMDIPQKATGNSSDATRLEDELALKSTNPYERARAQLLTKMKKSDRTAIEKAESSGKMETNFYQTFLKNISKLGDTLSEEKS